MIDYLESLNPAQRQAVEHIDGPMLVLAGPGSGKTRVVTHRIANLIQHGIAPRNILAMTFTNKAALEMKNRVEQLVPALGQGRLWVSTFHKFCSMLLRRHGELVGLNGQFTIYDVADCKRLLKLVIDKVKPDYKFTPATAVNGISRLKSQMITAESYEASPRKQYEKDLKNIFEEYQSALTKSNAVDFDDMLLHVVAMLKADESLRADLDAQYRYVLVDEYQDTNVVQYEIIKLLNRDYKNLSVTGDPDQSIYGWRGAQIRNILDFEKDYPDCVTVRLEANYRSTPEILHVADTLITNNTQRKQKSLFTDNPSGAPVHLNCYADDIEEAQKIVEQISKLIDSGAAEPKDIAIFYRLNAQSRPIEEACNINRISYTLINSLEFYLRKEIKDIIGYLRLLSNPYDDVSFVRIVNEPTRGIGDTSISKLRDYASRQGCSLLQAAWEIDKIPAIKGRSAAAIKKFDTMVNAIFSLTGYKIQPLVDQILQLSGYRDQFSQSQLEDDINRTANINEFLNVAAGFDQRHEADVEACLKDPQQFPFNPLTVFLEEIALVADSDKLNSDKNTVSAMTIHSAKGLEFPYVFVVGIEDKLLPHERSQDNADQLEEERRLLFVAITRAKKELFLSYVGRRRMQGIYQDTAPSEFLMELPRSEMDCHVNSDFDDEPDTKQTELDDYPDSFPDSIPTGKKRFSNLFADNIWNHGNPWVKDKSKGGDKAKSKSSSKTGSKSKSKSQRNPDGFSDELPDTKFFDEF